MTKRAGERFLDNIFMTFCHFTFPTGSYVVCVCVLQQYRFMKRVTHSHSYKWINTPKKAPEHSSTSFYYFPLLNSAMSIYFDNSTTTVEMNIETGKSNKITCTLLLSRFPFENPFIARPNLNILLTSRHENSVFASRFKIFSTFPSKYFWSLRVSLDVDITERSLYKGMKTHITCDYFFCPWNIMDLLSKRSFHKLLRKLEPWRDRWKNWAL
jgi:hypothetical protein